MDLFDWKKVKSGGSLDEYHTNNPQVYRLFKEFTMQAIRSGKRNYSAKGIFERMRWEAHMKYGDDGFKINNNYTAGYARKFMREHPEHDGFFRTRQLTSDMNL